MSRGPHKIFSCKRTLASLPWICVPLDILILELRPPANLSFATMIRARRIGVMSSIGGATGGQRGAMAPSRFYIF
ncbi:hypothetical protein DsansV1_C27g0197691 [Dioscorea sansibarensis]